MNQQRAFTLIEVLIAVIVLSIGLLGTAALQVSSLKNNQSAYYLSQATQAAYDIADRIRANRVEASLGVTSTYVTKVPSTAGQISNCTTPSGCSSSQMAVHDLYEWYHSINTLLPGGTGDIDYQQSLFVITVRWDDNRDGITDNADPSFQTDFTL